MVKSDGCDLGLQSTSLLLDGSGTEFDIASHFIRVMIGQDETMIRRANTSQDAGLGSTCRPHDVGWFQSA